MEPHLNQLSIFQNLLATYQPSPKAQQVITESHLVLLVGPTSVGRNAVIDALVATGKYQFIVSDTTRAPRLTHGVLEQQGQDYWFRSEADMIAGIKAGQYLAPAIIHGQQVSGINVEALAAANKTYKIAIQDIEIEGAAQIQALKPDTVVVFVLPPTFDEWLRRFKQHEGMPKTEQLRRLRDAVNELRTAQTVSYFCFIVNDTIEQAVMQIETIVAGANNPADQTPQRTLAQNLHNALNSYLQHQPDF